MPTPKFTKKNPDQRTTGDVVKEVRDATPPAWQVAIDYYFSHRLNGAEAYRAAGGQGKHASTGFIKMLESPEAQEYFRTRGKEYRDAHANRVASVTERLHDIADVDASEYLRVISVNCRYCHSPGHEHPLYKPSEWRSIMRQYERDLVDAEILAKQPPDFPFGGPGFEPYREPHPECPECGGRGETIEQLIPTDQWSPRARRAFAGLKKTKDGIEVKTLDVHKSLEMMAKIGNMMKDHEEAGAGEVHVHLDEKDSKA